MELKDSPNFIQAYKIEKHKHHSTGGLAVPCVFSTDKKRCFQSYLPVVLTVWDQ
jgi:hypothetical protein